MYKCTPYKYMNCTVIPIEHIKVGMDIVVSCPCGLPWHEIVSIVLPTTGSVKIQTRQYDKNCYNTRFYNANSWIAIKYQSLIDYMEEQHAT